MKKLAFIVALLLSGSLLNAQDNDQDPKAKSILDELSKKTKSYTTIKADFSFTTESKDKKKETQNGIITIKGDKYKLEIKGQVIISDGINVWTYLKDANEVQINKVDKNASADAVSPTSIFTLYENGFKYKFEKEEKLNGVVNQAINLFPANPDKKKYHTAKLLVDKTKKQISSLIMVMKDGSKNTYTIKKFTANTKIPDSAFSFDTKTYPGIEVVDLRD